MFYVRVREAREWYFTGSHTGGIRDAILAGIFKQGERMVERQLASDFVDQLDRCGRSLDSTRG
jgi:hypothetical protein